MLNGFPISLAPECFSGCIRWVSIKSLLPCPTCCSSITQTPSLTRVRSACRLNSFLGFHVLKPSPIQSTQLTVWPGPSISLTPTTTHQSPPSVTLKVYTVLQGSDLLHSLAIMVSACLCLGLIATMSPPTQTHSFPKLLRSEPMLPEALPAPLAGLFLCPGFHHHST